MVKSAVFASVSACFCVTMFVAAGASHASPAAPSNPVAIEVITGTSANGCNSIKSNLAWVEFQTFHSDTRESMNQALKTSSLFMKNGFQISRYEGSSFIAGKDIADLKAFVKYVRTLEIKIDINFYLEDPKNPNYSLVDHFNNSEYYWADRIAVDGEQSCEIYKKSIKKFDY